MVEADSFRNVKGLLNEPLDSVMTMRLSINMRQGLREIGKYYGASEGEIVRRMVTILVRAFFEAKSQASLGKSLDELISRTTRFTLMQFMNMPPSDLRRMADEFSKAAHALADLIEANANKEESGRDTEGRGGDK